MHRGTGTEFSFCGKAHDTLLSCGVAHSLQNGIRTEISLRITALGQDLAASQQNLDHRIKLIAMSNKQLTEKHGVVSTFSGCCFFSNVNRSRGSSDVSEEAAYGQGICGVNLLLLLRVES